MAGKRIASLEHGLAELTGSLAFKIIAVIVATDLFYSAAKDFVTGLQNGIGSLGAG
ncbi:MAG TPA: hypothetical protein VF471_05620 [Pseudoxanthomonas sp.]